MKHWSKATSRTARTGTQVAVTTVIMGLVEAFFELTEKQNAALAAAVLLAVTFAMNWVEARTDRHLMEAPVHTGRIEAYKPEPNEG